MKSINVTALLFIFVIISSCTSLNKLTETSKLITQKVESTDFTITANIARPLRMNQVQLTSGYDLQIKNDSAFAFLPYYGVAHIAPFNPSESAIKFKEPMADYTIKPTKKQDGWEIYFKVKAETTRYNIHISVFKNGSSSFTIGSYDKDAITFYGEIKE